MRGGVRARAGQYLLGATLVLLLTTCGGRVSPGPVPVQAAGDVSAETTSAPEAGNATARRVGLAESPAERLAPATSPSTAPSEEPAPAAVADPEPAQAPPPTAEPVLPPPPPAPLATLAPEPPPTSSTRTDPAVPEPTRVLVSRIGVNNPLTPVGLHPDRTLVVPENAQVAGWYTGAPRPGETGPAIVTGHNWWNGSPGVFSKLYQAVPGDVIEVQHDDGSSIRFLIERVEQHPKDQFPTARVYGNTSRPEIRIITCGGAFDQRTRSHVDNIIAFGVRID